MASAAPPPPSVASKNAAAQFVLEGDGKGYVRGSTAAAPATPTLMVDLIVRIAGRGVPYYAAMTAHCVALLGAKLSLRRMPHLCPQRATKAHPMLPHARESRGACALSDRSYAFAREGQGFEGRCDSPSSQKVGVEGSTMRMSHCPDTFPFTATTSPL